MERDGCSHRCAEALNISSTVRIKPDELFVYVAHVVNCTLFVLVLSRIRAILLVVPHCGPRENGNAITTYVTEPPLLKEKN